MRHCEQDHQLSSSESILEKVEDERVRDLAKALFHGYTSGAAEIVNLSNSILVAEAIDHMIMDRLSKLNGNMPGSDQD